jgi:hypothetical protein
MSQTISKGFIQFSGYKWTAVCGQIALLLPLIGYSCRPYYTTKEQFHLVTVGVT